MEKEKKDELERLIKFIKDLEKRSVVSIWDKIIPIILVGLIWFGTIVLSTIPSIYLYLNYFSPVTFLEKVITFFICLFVSFITFLMIFAFYYIIGR
jgi:hypothetical protein